MIYSCCFLFVLNAPWLQGHKSFLFYERKKCKEKKTKATEWHNEIKPSKNESKMNICQLTLYLNHFHSNHMFGRTLRKLFCFSFFCGIVKVICELQHTFFINLRLGKYWICGLWHCFIKPAFCIWQIYWFCDLRQDLHPTPRSLAHLCFASKVLFCKFF